MTPKNFGWPLAAVLIVAILAAGFGILSLSTSLTTAIAVGLIVVGLARLFVPSGNPLVGSYLLGAGLLMYFLGDSLMPTVTIADTLSFAGVDVG